MYEIIRKMFYGVALIIFGIVVIFVNSEREPRRKDPDMVWIGIGLIVGGVALIGYGLFLWRLMDTKQTSRVVGFHPDETNSDEPKQHPN